MRVAPAMLPHIADRGVTLRRYPNGVDEQSFFEKRCPSHRPEWIGTFDGPGRPQRHHRLLRARLDGGAGVVGQHGRPRDPRADGARRRHRRRPRCACSTSTRGRGTGIPECAEVALDIREVLDNLAGLECLAKTSGSKGLQVYVPLNTPAHPRALLGVRAGGRPGAGEAPPEAGHVDDGEVGPARARSSSTGARTAATRPRSRCTRSGPGPRPTVSTPVTWDEVEAAAGGGDLVVRGRRRPRPGRASTATSSRRPSTLEQELPDAAG